MKINSIPLPHFIEHFSMNGRVLRNLKVLHLNECRINDVAIDLIKATCKRLIRLSLNNNDDITLDKLEELVKANPRINVAWDGLIVCTDSL